MYTCIYVYIYIYIHIYIHTHIYMYTHVDIVRYVYMYMYMCIERNVYLAYIEMRKHTCIQDKQMTIYIYICRERERERARSKLLDLRRLNPSFMWRSGPVAQSSSVRRHGSTPVLLLQVPTGKPIFLVLIQGSIEIEGLWAS